jgi:S-adenosylmethionine:diacylglycerol 3-amino-3-carboxypropyl transferase
LVAVNLGAGKSDSPVSSQLREIPFAKIVNVEVFEPYFSYLRTVAFAARAVEEHREDILEWLHRQEAKSVDVVFILDVLEHFNRMDALFLLFEARMIARKRVIIWLPIGSCVQTAFDGNPYQEHKSTWTSDDFLDAERTVYWAAKEVHEKHPADAGLIVYDTKGGGK